MKTEIKIPEVGESVKEALLTQWYRRDGDYIRQGEILFLIETDKVTLEVVAEGEGILKILVPEGATVPVGGVVATLEHEDAAAAVGTEALPPQEAPGSMPAASPGTQAFPSPGGGGPAPEKGAAGLSPGIRMEPRAAGVNIVPSALRLAEEKGVDLATVPASGPGGRVTRGDVLLYLEEASLPETEEVPAGAPPPDAAPGERRIIPMAGETLPVPAEPVTRQPMSRIRLRIAERLLHARQNTAMLTTFNEVDMTRVQTLRAQFRDAYQARYGVSLGIVTFFIKASVAALKEYPVVNAFIEGQEIVYHHYYHIGVAIGAERGLVVPVIRHADQLGFAALDQAIRRYVKKVRENRLELSELEGGTFTISNGGVYGSLLSTPILNPPQSGILGLHKIEDRPVAMMGEVVIRPMMYLAFSYDHRLIDGREAVSFLKRIKEGIENPERIMLEV